MNITRPQFLGLLALTLTVFACEEGKQRTNKFSDAVLVKIAHLQDRRLADSLDLFLDHENALYRKEAVTAFGSLQTAPDIDRIGKLLLMDRDADVRGAAAFALGQIEHPSIERILLGALLKEKEPQITAEILNAYGKRTSEWRLDPSLFLHDSLKSAGMAWSIYRAGLRGKVDTAVNAVAMRLLEPTRSMQTRLGAAHYFARGARNFSKAEKSLALTASSDVVAEVRMAATLALGNIPSDSALASIKKIIKQETDFRVTVNAIKALGKFPYRLTKHYLYEALQNGDVSIGVAASEVIIENVPDEDWMEVSSLTNQLANWRIRANIYEAALKASRNKDLAVEVTAAYQKAKDSYERAAYLGALKAYPEAYHFMVKELRRADTDILRSTAANTLVAMNKTKSFPPSLKQRFALLYIDLMTTEDDPAVLGILASALADTTLNYRGVIPDPSFLQKAREKLKLPEDNESMQSVEAAIAYFNGSKHRPQVSNDYNHPIDWNLVRKIREDQLATIHTVRGRIVIRLHVNESPGSVANFVSLAQMNYFDNKPIHRVVPNFVIQAGCDRGDGWGSEDYSIRSEFSLRRYKTGSVGMASAGKDTEGTQWFITYSPTPHLDGRYSIFAEVVEGLGVLEYLQVGDNINDVIIEDFTAQ